MYEKKIENFTDRIFSNLKPNKTVSKPKTERKKWNLDKNQIDRNSNITPLKYKYNDQQRKQVQLSKADIDKLQLMSFDLSAENYLNKLIQIYEQQKAARTQDNLIPSQQFGQRQFVQRQRFYRRSSKQEQSILIYDNNFKDKDCVIEAFAPNSKQRSILKKNGKIGTNLQCQTKNQIKDQSKEQFLDRNQPLRETQIFQQKIQITHFKNVASKKALNERKTANKNSFVMKKIKTKQVKVQDKILKQDKNSLTKNKKKSFDQDSIKQSEIQQKNQQNKRIKQQKQQTTLVEQQQIPNVKNLEQMCYTQIGKRMIVTSQRQIRRQLFNSNIHIRSYLMKNIVQYVKDLADNDPQSIFILPNQKGLHFQPNTKPKELNPYLEHTKYVHIIRDINHIIQKSIYKQKYKESAFDSWPYFMIALFIALMVMFSLVIFIGDANQYLKNFLLVTSGLLISIFIVILIGYSLYCFRKQINFRPVCDIIYQEIDSYFKFINGKMQSNIEWIIGQSFFWIQVKIHPERSRQNPPQKQNVGKFRHRLKFYHQNFQQQVP